MVEPITTTAATAAMWGTAALLAYFGAIPQRTKDEIGRSVLNGLEEISDGLARTLDDLFIPSLPPYNPSANSCRALTPEEIASWRHATQLAKSTLYDVTRHFLTPFVPLSHSSETSGEGLIKIHPSPLSTRPTPPSGDWLFWTGVAYWLDQLLIQNSSTDDDVPLDDPSLDYESRHVLKTRVQQHLFTLSKHCLDETTTLYEAALELFPRAAARSLAAQQERSNMIFQLLADPMRPANFLSDEDLLDYFQLCPEGWQPDWSRIYPSHCADYEPQIAALRDALARWRELNPPDDGFDLHAIAQSPDASAAVQQRFIALLESIRQRVCVPI